MSSSISRVSASALPLLVPTTTFQSPLTKATPSLGVARNILTKRLTKLVDAGIMRKEPYQEHPPRYEYRLTEKGRDLVPILTSLLAWGDKWETENEPPVRLIHTVCDRVMHSQSVCSECGDEINAFNLRLDPVPQIVVERALTAKLASHST